MIHNLLLYLSNLHILIMIMINLILISKFINVILLNHLFMIVMVPIQNHFINFIIIFLILNNNYNIIQSSNAFLSLSHFRYLSLQLFKSYYALPNLDSKSSDFDSVFVIVCTYFSIVINLVYHSFVYLRDNSNYFYNL